MYQFLLYASVQQFTGCNIVSVLNVEGIKPRHCELRFSSGTVSLTVRDGMCSINCVKVEGEQNLRHGKFTLLNIG